MNGESDSLFARLGPSRLGSSGELLVAAILLLFAGFLVAGKASARRDPSRPEPPDDFAEIAHRLEQLEARHPGHPAAKLLGGLLVASGITLVALGARAVRRAVAPARVPGPDGGAPGASPDDPLSRPPPWGVLDFGLAFLGSQFVFAFVQSLALAPPLLEVEGGKPVLLRSPVAFGAPASPSSASATNVTIVPLPGSSAERARIEPGPDGLVLRAHRSTAGSPVVLVDGQRLEAGERRLRDGTLLRIGDVSGRVTVQGPVSRILVLCVASLASGALFILYARARGGTLADLGLRREGALLEVGRGFAGWLALVSASTVAAIGWTAVCRALGVPVAGHPLLKELEADPTPGPILAVVLLAVVVAPVVEEIQFRGFLLRALRRPIPSRAGAVLLSSIFFASVHPGLVSFLPILVVGSAFALVYVTSRRASLVGAIVAHAAFNATNIAVQLLLL